MNSLQYIQNSRDYNAKLENNPNINIGDSTHFNLRPKTNEEIMSDDLLSTHPFMGTDIFVDDVAYIQKTQKELFEKNKPKTEITTKLFIINSKDRNPYYESFLNFSVKFNPSSDIFENQPIYYNNPTIPQTPRERELGLRGPKNHSGWKDSLGNIYPAFNSSLPSGDIISYDSIKISGTNIAYIPFQLKNVISIKLDKLILPKSLAQDPVSKDGDTVTPSYWYFTMTNVDNNYEITSLEINNLNDILIPQNDSAVQKNIWIPISDVKATYNPPRNSFNVIKFDFISPSFMVTQYISNISKFLEDPDITANISGPDSNHEYFILFLEKLWLKDVISVKKIEFCSPYIILHTTLFSQGRYVGRWRDFTQVLLNNLVDNLDLDDNMDEEKRSLVMDFILSFSNKNHSILFTAFIGNEDINIDMDKFSETGVISSLLNYFEINNSQISQDIFNITTEAIPFGNRIIFVGPVNNKYNPNVDIDMEYYKNGRTIGMDKISIPLRYMGWDIILTQFLDSPILTTLQLLFPNGINLKRTKAPDWVGSGPYALNLSMQILFSLKVEMLTPLIEHI
jgi:hypothetical protein